MEKTEGVAAGENVVDVALMIVLIIIVIVQSEVMEVISEIKTTGSVTVTFLFHASYIVTLTTFLTRQLYTHMDLSVQLSTTIFIINVMEFTWVRMPTMNLCVHVGIHSIVCSMLHLERKHHPTVSVTI